MVARAKLLARVLNKTVFEKKLRANAVDGFLCDIESFERSRTRINVNMLNDSCIFGEIHRGLRARRRISQKHTNMYIKLHFSLKK